ncbi:MAG: hypothetical protein K1W41_26310 [Lachnospiraceae bacterium]
MNYALSIIPRALRVGKGLGQRKTLLKAIHTLRHESSTITLTSSDYTIAKRQKSIVIHNSRD